VLASHPAKDYGPVYSPSGDRIAFISHRKARSAEEILNAYREYHEILTHGSNSEGRAAMQRMKNFESDGDIFVANADGSDVRQLTHDSAMDKSLCWSPCGDYLMYTAAPRSDTGGERLKIINSSTGEAIPFRYDRRAFEAEVQSERLLNQTIFQKLIPDALERLFLDHSFFGEERNPHWKA
jgi:Tol biopolymer transport system component